MILVFIIFEYKVFLKMNCSVRGKYDGVTLTVATVRKITFLSLISLKTLVSNSSSYNLAPWISITLIFMGIVIKFCLLIISKYII